MTSKQTRIAALAAVLALPIGAAGLAIASAQNTVHVAAQQPAAAAPSSVIHAMPDNDAETNDDPVGDGDGETNDDGPGGSSVRSH